jgi:CAAX protease family protein
MSPKLRALGRLAVFCVLVFLVFPSKKLWLPRLFPGIHGVAGYVLDHMIELAAILIFSSIMAAIERRPFGAYGLPGRQAFRGRFWQGALAGLVSLTLLVTALAATGGLQVSVAPTAVLPAVAISLGYATLFLLLAIREEFLYRGYGLFTLTEVVGFWPAAIASTAWFAWSHAGNANESALGLANVAVFGLLACLALKRTGNLWLVIGFHASWDWGETYLFGVGDSGHPPVPGHLLTAIVSSKAPPWLSGGSVGPEGSALCAGIFVILWLACMRLLPASAQRAAELQAQRLQGKTTL